MAAAEHLLHPPASVIKEAMAQWNDDIEDYANCPASISQIDEYIRSGLGWGWTAPYRRDGDFAWCGAFAAWCWRAAGLHPDVAARYWSSTYRLDLWSQYKPFGDEAPTHVELALRVSDRRLKTFYDTIEEMHAQFGGRRLRVEANFACETVAALQDAFGYTPLPGDVATVGNRKSYGTHVVLVLEAPHPELGFVTTIEGNAHGKGPEGNYREGVVINQRLVRTFARFYRPAPLDLCPNLRFFRRTMEA